jgi:flagellar hook-associated protein 3 FlgL
VRIAFGHSFDEGLRAVNTAAEQLALAQQRVATGRRIQVPSDDPAGTAQAIVERSSLASLDAYERAAQSADSRLGVADAALADIVRQLTAAKTAAVASHTSSRTPQQLEAYASEVLGIRDAIFGDINTKFGGSYLFAGTGVNPPYAAVGGTYQGTTTPLTVDLTSDRTAQISFDGSAIIGPDVSISGSSHILIELTNLATAILAGNTAGIDAGIPEIDAAFDRATLAENQVGIAQRTIADVGAQITAARIGTQSRISLVEDVNMAEAISDLNRAEIAQQSTLGSFATLARLTLLDFLK